MKKALRTVLLAFLSYIPIISGLQAQSSMDIRQGNIDYPVPTPIAVMSLGSETPAFLSPSTVRNFVISTEGHWSAVAPRYAVGIECAPLLLGDGIDLSTYLSGRLNRVLYRTRISVGAEASSSGGMNTSLGLRFMLHDDADLRADSVFQRMLVAWAMNSPKDAYPCHSDSFSIAGRSCLTESVARDRDMQQRIDSLKDNWSDKNWRRSVFELAVAAVYHSGLNGGLENTLAVRRYSGYFSAGCHLQLGVSGALGYDDAQPSYQHQGNITFRLCDGSVSEQAYAGIVLATRADQTPDHRLELGGVARIQNGMWVRGMLGTSLHQHSNRGSEAQLTLSFGTPELR